MLIFAVIKYYSLFKQNFMKTINLNPSSLANAYKNTTINPLTWITNFEDPQTQGILDYINPIIQDLEHGPIPEYCTLISLTTLDNEEQGTHIFAFQIDNPDDFKEQEYLTGIFNQIFPLDPDACLIAPTISYTGSHFIITVPYTC